MSLWVGRIRKAIDRIPVWFELVLLPLVAVAVALLVYPRPPENSQFIPCCPFFALTGLYCPGCGTLRGIHRLLHGDLLAAVGYNVMMVSFIPVIIGWYGWRIYAIISKNPPVIPPRLLWFAGWTTLVLVLAFWVLRNIPVTPFSYLAP